MQLNTFYWHQNHEQGNFYEKFCLYIVGRSIRDGNVTTYLQLAQKWNLSSKIRRHSLFYQHSQPLYDVLQKEIENLEIVQGVNFEFTDSLENNVTKYLLIFDDSCEELGPSKAFVDIATAGRHRGLSTIHFKHNLFHQSEFGRDVDLQNTRKLLFSNLPMTWSKSARLVNRWNSDQTALVDWYWDATCVLYGHLSIDLSPGTDDRLAFFFTIIGFIPSKLFIDDRPNQSKLMDDEHTKPSYSPSVPIRIPHVQMTFLESWPTEFVQFLFGCIVKILQGDLQGVERHHVTKFQNEVRLFSKERVTSKQRRDVLASEKGLQLIKVITPPLINHLLW